MSNFDTQQAACSLTELSDLVIYRATGADAVSFLHGQLTNDVTGLPAGKAALAGYCTPKGRLLATLVYWQDHTAQEPSVYLMLKQDLAQAVIKRLAMFVLRAKVHFDPVPTTVLGAAASGPAHSLPAGLPANPWQYTHTSQGFLLRVPDNETPRWWWVPDQNAELPVADQTDTALQCWQAADIRAGLPWVTAGTQDTFIPQTLNLDLIDGVSFTKGCYPGQEVVARAHYRGTVKRRMAAGQTWLPASGQPPQPGTDTYQAGNENPVGRLINGAIAGPADHAGNQPLVLLMEVQHTNEEPTSLRLGAPDGPPIEPLALPYPTA
jgi:hypothetical protein